jgi:acyl transferase domain-containing protein
VTIQPGNIPTSPTTEEPVAVIGMSCRLPQATGPAEFWRLLASGTSAIRDLPDGRRQVDGARGPAPGGFLDTVDGFDARFFGISPREALAMDPQQRLMLELGWEALEDAHIVPGTLGGSRTGVFVGAIWDDYAALTHRAGDAAITHHTMTGLHRGIIANRLSYTLGLRGPSMTVDSAQSSSLVAVHLAVECLRRGEAEVALAGGVNLILDPFSTTGSEQFGGLSRHGRCFTFDDRADGYVRGEGGGVVVLKPLAAARADGNRVYAVILGGAMNNDGSTDGLTTPGVAGQQDVLQRAYERAGVQPDEVQYVELHGSGTPVGDPVEAAALGTVLGAGRPPTTPLLVGSAKTNVGHLEGAAGIVGLLKAVLSLHHGQVPASLNFETPNRKIPLDELGLRVVQDLTPWPATRDRRYAGVSSFGMGGTNCHVVLSDEGGQLPGAAGPPARDAGPLVLAWSARSETAVRAQAHRLAQYLTDHPDTNPADVAHTLATTRTHFNHRGAVIAPNRTELLNRLTATAHGHTSGGSILATAAKTGRVAFVFPGQGSQWAGMATGLLDTEAVFTETMQACAEALAPYTRFRLLDALTDPDALGEVDIVQPVLFAVMVSLARLWQYHGMIPDAVTGHSQGEIAAAHIAGALSLDDAANVVATRARLLTRLTGTGAMASIGLPAKALGLDDWPGLEIAAYNSPATTVITGDPDQINAYLQHVTTAGNPSHAQLIPVTYASHGAHIQPLRDELLAALAGINPTRSVVPFYSATTGDMIADTTTLTGEYWYRNLRSPVLLQTVAQALARTGHTTFIEVSPHPVLTPAISQTLDTVESAEERSILVTGTLHRATDPTVDYHTTLATLWTHGILAPPPPPPPPATPPTPRPTPSNTTPTGSTPPPPSSSSRTRLSRRRTSRRRTSRGRAVRQPHRSPASCPVWPRRTPSGPAWSWFAPIPQSSRASPPPKRSTRSKPSRISASTR